MEAIRKLEFVKNISLTDFLLFFIYVFAIFIVNRLILLTFKKVYQSDESKKCFIPSIEAILNWMAFYGTIILFLFYFSKEKWLKAPIYNVKGIDVSLLLILVAIMIITFANRLVKTVTVQLMPIVYEKFHVDEGTSYTINRLIYYTVMITAVIISLATVGFNWKAVAIVFSTLGIGIGFGLRNIAANFVSGLIILFEKPLKVGEVIEIEGQTGIVSKVKLRSTSLNMYKDGTLIVPNQYLIENVITNLADDKLFTNIAVGVAYGSDTEKVESLLREAVARGTENEDSVLPAPEPSIRLVDFQETALQFTVEIPVRDIRAKELIENKLRHRIIALFYKNNIPIGNTPLEEPGNNDD